MNRRDLMKRLAGVSALAGTGVTVSTVAVTAQEQTPTKPALAVIECDNPISQETMQRIGAYFQQALEDTPFAGVKVLVLADGLKLTILDANGRILNDRLDPKEVAKAILDAPIETGRVDITDLRRAEPMSCGRVLPDYNAGVTWNEKP